MTSDDDDDDAFILCCLSSPVLDASGKPSRGILKGNTRMHGNYDQCKAVSQQRSDLSREIKGRYCGAEIQLPPGLFPPIPGKVGAFFRFQNRLRCLKSFCLCMCSSQAIPRKLHHHRQTWPGNCLRHVNASRGNYNY